MRILFFTKYAYLGASSRYRTHQYIPVLKQYGITCKISPLLDDQYLFALYSKKKYGLINYLKRLVNRLITLMQAKNFDLVIIEKELIPYFPPILEYFLKILKIKYVLDYDDAIFHRYEYHNNEIIRVLLGNKIKKIMSWSSSVITGSSYLTQYADRYAKMVSEIPTVIDFNRYSDSNNNHNGEFIIGWIGTPITSPYLLDVFSVLQEFTQHYKSKVKLIGFDKDLLPEVNSMPLEIVKWSEETEVEEISSFSVGIMPLDDKPWSHGKCGLKLIQYMGCGIPVIASPIGANNIIVDNEINGFLAKSPEDWYHYLQILYNDKEKREKMGKINQEKIKNCYSIQVTASKYFSLLKSVVS